MDYLFFTSVAIALCCLLAIVFFSAVVLLNLKDWIYYLSCLGVITSVAFFCLYFFNITGIWPTPIDPSRARPILFLVAVTLAVFARSFYTRSKTRK